MATTDLRRACAGLAFCALLALPCAAQQPPSEQQLIERLRQIQAELRGSPAAAPAAEGTAPADPALLSPQQVEEDVGTRLGVQVLGIEQVEGDGAPRYAVKVMNPPGNYNAAFMVSTVLVDAASGEILGETTAADAGPPGPAGVPESGPEARQRTWR